MKPSNRKPKSDPVDHKNARRRVCFVTGTRAEFGLMQSVLRAIAGHPKLSLQMIATGMHLSALHGRTVQTIRKQGWKVDATVPWPAGDGSISSAMATGQAVAKIAAKLDRLNSDIVLVVGDRVEAFAGAVAGHLSGRVVAHVHGGDRALGQVDDALRHAITKLAHLHFPATIQSARRILKLGEDTWRIHRCGSPGIDGIEQAAAEGSLPADVEPKRYALLVLHPTQTQENVEFKRARMVLSAVRRCGFDRIVIVYPNNDPGSAGIIRCWKQYAGDAMVFRDVARPDYLRLLRDAAVLIGNSSSGIIEAASLGTRVVNIGPRQRGRECSENVIHVGFEPAAIDDALARVWGGGRAGRFKGKNVYTAGGAGEKIADVLAATEFSTMLRQKLIAY